MRVPRRDAREQEFGVRSFGARPPGAAELEYAMRNPALAAAAELKDQAERSLIAFIRLMWHTIEPGQPLRVGWAMQAMAEHLEAVHYGKIRRLLINCPPGFSKSTLVNVFLPAWEWGPRRRPDLRYISWAYGEHLTERDNVKCAALIDSPLYQALWGGGFTWDPRQNTKTFYKTDQQGFKFAAGVHGMGTGERGDRLSVDDPHSVMEAESDARRKFATNWFGGTYTSRVRNANPYVEVVEGVEVLPSSSVVIMQRVHHQDVAGVILANELDYEHLLIEMVYEGAAHPARKRPSKKRKGQLAWRGSSIGYVDPREAWSKAADELVAAHVAVKPWDAEADDGDGGKGAWTTDDDEVWWWQFGFLWLVIAADVARLADPVRYSRAAVEEWTEAMLLMLGTNAVSAQLRQWPNEGTGDMFKPEDWLYCEAHEVPGPCVMYDVRGWDLGASEAQTSDGTGAVKMRRGSDNFFYVFHAERRRVNPGEAKTFREQMRKTDGPTVIQDFPQDPGQAGKDQVETFAADAPGTVTRSSLESGSKVVRANPMSALQQHRRIKLVRGLWNQAFVEEYAEFPHSTMSALVDAGSRAFNRLAKMPKLSIPGGSSTVTSDGTLADKMAKLNAMPKLNRSVRRPEVDDELDDGGDDYDD